MVNELPVVPHVVVGQAWVSGVTVVHVFLNGVVAQVYTAVQVLQTVRVGAEPQIAGLHHTGGKTKRGKAG